ncbi:hypothetical protein HU200_066495 [Digitaria exilis]|uniref:Uncharacterized protein n=1 Tax=Digitaria exilis TaxID=1010633 RepID=A0A835DTT6_9POAL|nr:hypothetical protein HU200_066495 [Digitaria exilis]
MHVAAEIDHRDFRAHRAWPCRLRRRRGGLTTESCTIPSSSSDAGLGDWGAFLFLSPRCSQRLLLSAASALFLVATSSASTPAASLSPSAAAAQLWRAINGDDISSRSRRSDPVAVRLAPGSSSSLWGLWRSLAAFYV